MFFTKAMKQSINLTPQNIIVPNYAYIIHSFSNKVIVKNPNSIGRLQTSYINFHFNRITTILTYKLDRVFATLK
jgi:hypothetical protein